MGELGMGLAVCKSFQLFHLEVFCLLPRQIVDEIDIQSGFQVYIVQITAPLKGVPLKNKVLVIIHD